MLEVAHLFVKKQSFSLRRICFKVKSGDFHVILGPTGCGKTTLLETLMGFHQPHQGEIYFQGQSLLPFPPHRRPFAYVPQDLALFPHMTVGENILYGAKMRKVPPSPLLEKIVEATEIGPLWERRPGHLSSGERQRVALARAIGSGQTWLLLDEPFSALHRGMKQELWQILKHFQKAYHLTFLLVTHDIEEAMTLGDSLSVMIQGEIHQQGSAEEVYTKPVTKEVAHFFGISNLFPARVVERQGQTISIESSLGKFSLCSSLPLSVGEKCLVGIRKEHILVGPKGRYPLLGRVKGVLFSGSFYTLQVVLADETLIHVALSPSSFQKFSFHFSQLLSLFLPSEYLFILSESGQQTFEGYRE